MQQVGYRLVYEVDDKTIIVLVLAIGKRDRLDVYKKATKKKTVMNIFIILLRSINVGGNNIISMKELKLLLSAKGYTNVQTYIQSGNIVLTSLKNDKEFIKKEISELIFKKFGFLPDMLILSAKKLLEAIDNNPFSSIDINSQKLYLYFCLDTPNCPHIEALELLKTKTEQVCLTDNVLYFYAPEGVGRSKLASKIDKVLGIKTTARNLRTIKKLQEMLCQ